MRISDWSSDVCSSDLLAGPIARLSSINFNYLAPFMIMLIMFAAFQSQKAWGDIFEVVLLGIVAFYMRRYGSSRPALVVGFVRSAERRVRKECVSTWRSRESVSHEHRKTHKKKQN